MKSLIHISQRIDIDQNQILGKGTTGNVYLGFQSSNHNKKYAVKAIDLSKITNPVTQYLLSCQIMALVDLSKLSNKHIVKLQSSPIYHDQYIYLVMELLEGGPLSDLIFQFSRGMQQIQALKLSLQILSAYRVIKEHKIIHRDIKPDNLIFRKPIKIDQKGSFQGELCFIDFGYCLKQSVPNKPEGYYNVGSPKYMSPEAFKESKYSEKSDIWAMGVILYEMLHGTTIDAGMNMEQYFLKMKTQRLVIKRGISPQVCEVLTGMLANEVDKRFQLQMIEEKIKNILIDEKRRNLTSANPKQNVPQLQFQEQNSNNSFNQNSQRSEFLQGYKILPSNQSNNQKNNQILSNSHKTQQNKTLTNEATTSSNIGSHSKPVQIKNILYISDQFIIDQDELLGKGSTGNVYLGFDASNHNKKYAVKAIDLSQITNPVTNYLLCCQIVALTDLAKINCKNIVKLEKIIFHEKYCYLVTQLLEGGSLADHIRNNSKGLIEKQAINLFRQMFQAFGVIKEHKIIHRDIKPDNLIFRKPIKIDQKGSFQGELCFIDFGYCLKQSVPNKPEGYYNVGSPKYMSPEAFKESKYSEKSDIWAMGVILYEMLHGTTIDAGMNMEQYFLKMQTQRLVIKRGISSQVCELLSGMLAYEVQERLKYDEVKNRLQKVQGNRIISNNAFPLSEIRPVPSVGQPYSQLKVHQQSLNPHDSGHKVELMHSRTVPVIQNQSVQNNSMIPQLQLRQQGQSNQRLMHPQNTNFHIRNTQRLSTQQPTFLHQQNQPQSVTKSNIFPQQHNSINQNGKIFTNLINQKGKIFRNSINQNRKIFPSEQNINQPFQRIEQERQHQNGMKRPLIMRQDSNEKLRKMNMNKSYIENNKLNFVDNKNETVILPKGVNLPNYNQKLNSYQYKLKNSPPGINSSPNDSKGLRQSIGDKFYIFQLKNNKTTQMGYQGNRTIYSGTDIRYPASTNKYQGTDIRYPASDKKYPESNKKYPGSDKKYLGSDKKYLGSDVRFEQSGMKSEGNNVSQKNIENNKQHFQQNVSDFVNIPVVNQVHSENVIMQKKYIYPIGRQMERQMSVKKLSSGKMQSIHTNLSKQHNISHENNPIINNNTSTIKQVIVPHSPSIPNINNVMYQINNSNHNITIPPQNYSSNQINPTQNVLDKKSAQNYFNTTTIQTHNQNLINSQTKAHQINHSNQSLPFINNFQQIQVLNNIVNKNEQFNKNNNNNKDQFDKNNNKEQFRFIVGSNNIFKFRSQQQGQKQRLNEREINIDSEYFNGFHRKIDFESPNEKINVQQSRQKMEHGGYFNLGNIEGQNSRNRAHGVRTEHYHNQLVGSNLTGNNNAIFGHNNMQGQRINNNLDNVRNMNINNNNINRSIMDITYQQQKQHQIPQNIHYQSQFQPQFHTPSPQKYQSPNQIDKNINQIDRNINQFNQFNQIDKNTNQLNQNGVNKSQYQNMNENVMSKNNDQLMKKPFLNNYNNQLNDGRQRQQPKRQFPRQMSQSNTNFYPSNNNMIQHPQQFMQKKLNQNPNINSFYQPQHPNLNASYQPQYPSYPHNYSNNQSIMQSNNQSFMNSNMTSLMPSNNQSLMPSNMTSLMHSNVQGNIVQSNNLINIGPMKRRVKIFNSVFYPQVKGNNLKSYPQPVPLVQSSVQSNQTIPSQNHINQSSVPSQNHINQSPVKKQIINIINSPVKRQQINLISNNNSNNIQAIQQGVHQQNYHLNNQAINQNTSQQFSSGLKKQVYYKLLKTNVGNPQHVPTHDCKQ